MESDRDSDVGGDDPAYGLEIRGHQASPTVTCPNGHTNDWNYKFCAQCGAPIGLVPWPSEEAPSPTAAPKKSRVPLIAALSVLAVAVVLAVAAVTWWVTRPGDDAPTDEGFATDQGATPTAAVGPPVCEDSPVVEAESMEMTADGLSISAAFVSPCRGGDIESNTDLEVRVASGQRDIAAGSFDFSSEPMILEPGTQTRRTLIFPPGTYWRTPEMISGPPELKAARAGTSDPEAVNGDRDRRTMTAVAPAQPAHGSVDGVAGAVLEELRDADFAAVRGQLSNRWVPQVSSKRVDLVVDGRALTEADILRDHLAFRQRFDGARLLWSGHWTTFNSPDFWITVVGPPRFTADEANRWCDTIGFGTDDCFAKFVSTLFGVEGTTVYRR